MKPTSAVAIAALLLILPGLGSAQAPANDQPQYKAVLTSFQGSFESEAWKYNPQYNRGALQSAQDFESHIQNQSASFFSAMGQRVRLEIRIVDGNGQPATLDANVNVTASIKTGSGPLEAFILRKGDTGNEFILDFDVDGSRAGGPGGANLKPLNAGTHIVDVNIFRTGNLGEKQNIGTGQITFVYERPTVTLDLNLPRPGLARLPDDVFRLFNDMGHGSDVLAIDQVMDASLNLTAQVRLARAMPGQGVALNAFVARRGFTDPVTGGPQPAPVPTVNPPHVPGVTDTPEFQRIKGTSNSLVSVDRVLVGNTTTDRDGLANFSFAPNLVLQALNVNAAIILFAAELTDRAIPSGEASGGPGVRVGASEFVLPGVGTSRLANPVTVTAYSISGPGAGAPSQFQSLNQVNVRLYDPVGTQSGPGRVGDLFALVPREGSVLYASKVLGRASISQDPNHPNTDRTGRLPMDGIQSEGAKSYRTMALLYGDQDVFYTLTYADRGFDIMTEAPLARTDARAHFYVNLTSKTTNYDNSPSQPGFSLEVTLKIWSTELSLNRTEKVTLTEASRASVDVLVDPSKPGEYPIYVQAVTGDIVGDVVAGSLRVMGPAPSKGFIDRIPGFELPLALLGALGAVLLLRRR